MNAEFQGSPILPLLRPQYVPAPEGFLSALAWKEFAFDLKGATTKAQAVRYSQTNPGGSQAMEVRALKPQGHEVTRFMQQLEESGLVSTDREATARSVLESVGGVRIERSGVQPASPLTPSIALVQNMRGLLGAESPPDVAGILEAMFAMGVANSVPSHSASSLWKAAALDRVRIDPVLAKIDQAFDRAVLDNPRRDLQHEPSTESDRYPYFGPMTPYAWFSRAWTKLTKSEWVAAVPPRVWVDWATTVTRMAFGMGYLWEAAWFDAVAREALHTSKPPDVLGRIAQQPLIPWRPETNSVSIRDVASVLKWKVVRGVHIRSFLESCELDSNDVDSQVLELRSKPSAREELTAAIQSSTISGSGKNAWEAVRYALRTRESASDSADYYGLLVSRSPRYLVPAPGTEWMAVIASLATEQPGGQSEVASVMRELRALGLRPELLSLVQLLERAGLARGSADADQGVVVQSAF